MFRLTMAQALVRFLANQHTEHDGRRHRLIAGCFGIFGHGNLAGLGQALRQYPDELAYHQCRNEQAMVHTAAAYARMTDRMSTFACTASVGPGATNMITAAAGATINRLPVLLLPGDVFATRDEIFGPVLVVVRAQTLAEAIGLVNANPYRNGVALFSAGGAAAREFQRSVRVGMIGINVPIPAPMTFYSFGGWKASLFGDTHIHGPEGVSFYTQAKVVTARWPRPAARDEAHLHFPTAV